MHVFVEDASCIGCTLCASTCPEVFRMTPEGKAEAFCQPDASLQEQTREAANGCPTGAIHVQEDVPAPGAL